MKFFNGMTSVCFSGRVAAGCLVMLAATCAVHAQAPGPDHQALLRALNLLRQQGCDGRPAPAAALRENARLSEAAARIAGGSKLDGALQAADYRATRAAQITLSGYSGANALAQGAMAASCSEMSQSDLSEVGFYQRGTRTWVVLAAPFTPPGAAQAGDVQAQVLALVNAARARPRECGSESFNATRLLRFSATLQGVSAAHAADMARHSYFDHTGRDGSRVADRASRASYPWRAIGENIAAGQITADIAVQGWLKSPGHCANIMSPDFSEMGAAFAVNPKSSAGIYWVQVFGTPH
jgi:uncharacterized protein YkwD